MTIYCNPLHILTMKVCCVCNKSIVNILQEHKTQYDAHPIYLDVFLYYP